MKKTLVVYGSSTGTCQSIAETIAEKLGAEVIDVANLDDAQVNEAENLILGTSTWGTGEVQDDWYDGLNKLKKLDLNGKTVALFGCGDCESYGDTFCGGMDEIYSALQDKGVKFVGQVSTDDYTFDDSAAVVDGKFVGLALDDINEDDKTPDRIDAWLDDIKGEL